MYSEKGNSRIAEYGEAFELLYELGTGLGAEISQLLELKVEDVREKDYLSMCVGPRKCRRTFLLPENVKKRINTYIRDREGMLFLDTEGIPLNEDQARFVLASCGVNKPFINIVMKRYFGETNDIYYPMFFLNLPTKEVTLKAIC